MATYSIKLNLKDGGVLEVNDLTQKEFEKLSELCENILPDRDWMTEKITAIDA